MTATRPKAVLKVKTTKSLQRNLTIAGDDRALLRQVREGGEVRADRPIADADPDPESLHPDETSTRDAPDPGLRQDGNVQETETGTDRDVITEDDFIFQMTFLSYNKS